MIEASDIWAVVPIKEITASKRKLAGAFSPDIRRGLARAMIEDVLCTLASVSELAGLVVVTVDPDVSQLAASFGARIFEDGARDGQTGAVMAAARHLAREGRGGMLTMPGDVPGVTAHELKRVLAAHRQVRGFTIVPAHDRRGSNCIVMTPPDAVPLAFGNDSFLPHLAAARHANIEPTIVPLPGIGLDLDNPLDVLLFSRIPSSTKAWQFLEEAGLLPPTSAHNANEESRKS